MTAAMIGALLAGGVAVFARLSRFDRDRSFYATVLIVVASYYVLYAAIGGVMSVMAVELAGFAVFAIAAVVGARWVPWLVAVGLVAHGVFDMVHGALVTNPGMPAWWPAFCASYDVVAGVVLGVQRASSRPQSSSRA